MLCGHVLKRQVARRSGAARAVLAQQCDPLRRQAGRSGQRAEGNCRL